MGDFRLAAINRIIVDGRLGRDPELKYTPQGKAYCKFSLCNTRYFRNQQNEQVEENTWFNVTVWERQAEAVAEKLRKGRPVLVEGRMKSNNWTDKETGKERRDLEIHAERVSPLDWPDNNGGGARRAPAEAAAPAGQGGPADMPDEDIPF